MLIISNTTFDFDCSIKNYKDKVNIRVIEKIKSYFNENLDDETEVIRFIRK